MARSPSPTQHVQTANPARQGRNVLRYRDSPASPLQNRRENPVHSDASCLRSRYCHRRAQYLACDYSERDTWGRTPLGFYGSHCNTRSDKRHLRFFGELGRYIYIYPRALNATSPLPPFKWGDLAYTRSLLTHESTGEAVSLSGLPPSLVLCQRLHSAFPQRGRTAGRVNKQASSSWHPFLG